MEEIILYIQFSSISKFLRIPILHVSNESSAIALAFLHPLMIAYFLRYKEHKEAGLIDAPKTK